MRKVKSNTSNTQQKRRPAIDPEARQGQLIALAIDLVEKRLIEGTASSQETTHFLKLATNEARLKDKLLEAQTEMALAKKEQLQSQKRVEELYSQALKAMKNYSGQGDEDEYEY